MVKRATIAILLLDIILLLTPAPCLAQGYNAENKALSDFLTRMYKSNPFEGVRIITDYDNTYLVTVISLDKTKYQNESIMNRVASVKAMSEANRYLNGSNITMDMVIHMTEHQDGKTDTQIIERIQETATGYVKQLEQLTTFSGSNNRQVFIYYKTIN